jgi:hypothetical protein
VYTNTHASELKNIIEKCDEDQFANGESFLDLRMMREPCSSS